MRQLSESSRELLATLRLDRNLADRVLGRSRWNVDAIDQLGQSGEPAVIRHLVPVLYSGDPAGVLAAARAVNTLLAKTAVEDLPFLDESMRQSWHGDDWSKLAPRELAKWVGPGEPGVLLLRLSSMHPNGFVREEAVRRLRLLTDGSEVPYLLLRLNDWVPQVRSIAREAIDERIKPSYADALIRNLHLVARLAEVRRNDQREVLDRINQLLAGPEARAAMLDAMRNGSRTTRRASFRVLAADEASLCKVLPQALGVDDFVIRLQAVRAAARVLDRAELQSLLPKLSRDGSAPVRLEALRMWATSFPGEAASKALRAALLDRNASVRMEARYRLRNEADSDFRQIYRNAMSAPQPAVLMAAMAGLAETARSEDASELILHLSHPLARVRRTAVECLAKLGQGKHLELVIERAQDTSPKVSSEACKVLAQEVSQIDGSRVWQLLSSTPLPHVRRNLLRLATNLPKWESLVYLVRAIDLPDESLADEAVDHVCRWDAQYNRSQAVPSSEQLALLEGALNKAAKRLPVSVVDSIRFAIRSFS
jgi:HEAT repeat protein